MPPHCNLLSALLHVLWHRHSLSSALHLQTSSVPSSHEYTPHKRASAMSPQRCWSHTQCAMPVSDDEASTQAHWYLERSPGHMLVVHCCASVISKHVVGSVTGSGAESVALAVSPGATSVSSIAKISARTLSSISRFLAVLAPGPLSSTSSMGSACPLPRPVSVFPPLASSSATSTPSRQMQL